MQINIHKYLVVGTACAILGGGGVATAATTGFIDGHTIKHGSIPNNALSKQAQEAVQRASHYTHGPAGATGAQGPKGDMGPQGPAGADGRDGTPGTNGLNGKNGLNPATAVVNVPSIAPGAANDSGHPGDAGFYFSGNGSNGSASIANGELKLTGNGVDSNTVQGGIGIAKAFSTPLSKLDSLSYQWHADQTNATQAPTIHITVTGLKANSHFGSGFANLDYTPGINGITPSQGVVYQSDGFADNAKWFSTTNPSISAPGGQNSPETLKQFADANPDATITQISLDNGGTSGGTGSFAAGADNLYLSIDGHATRYDFGS
jgi:hypothetical protein